MHIVTSRSRNQRHAHAGPETLVQRAGVGQLESKAWALVGIISTWCDLRFNSGLSLPTDVHALRNTKAAATHHDLFCCVSLA
jgi:hypothetical protein